MATDATTAAGVDALIERYFDGTSLKVQYSAEKGRYVVATKPIEA
jgi:hypothetical protein